MPFRRVGLGSLWRLWLRTWRGREKPLFSALSLVSPIGPQYCAKHYLAQIPGVWAETLVLQLEVLPIQGTPRGFCPHHPPGQWAWGMDDATSYSAHVRPGGPQSTRSLGTDHSSPLADSLTYVHPHAIF